METTKKALHAGANLASVHYEKEQNLLKNSSTLRPLRICVICGDLNPNDLGGAEVHIVEVIKGLAEKGHVMEVFVGDDEGITRHFGHKNIVVHTVQYAKVKNLYSFSYILAARRRIGKFLKNNNVDLIHSKQTFPLGVVGTSLAKRFSLPHYITVQNPLSYKEELVIKSRVLPAFLKKAMQESLRPLAKYALRHCDIAACVSQYSMEHALKMGARRAELVPNGVDLKKFFPKVKDLFRPGAEYAEAGARAIHNGYEFFEKSAEEIWITTTSTLIPRNGVDILVRAFAELVKGRVGKLGYEAKSPGVRSQERSGRSFSEKNVRLKIAGIGPMREELDVLIAQLEISEKVDFLDTLRHEQVPDLLRASDLFVRPSRFEGFGMSFIEAMACGVPVIACPVGGITDFVEHNKTGVLVEPEDWNGLAVAMKELLLDRQRYVHIRDEALKMVRERYSWEGIVQKAEECYKKILFTYPVDNL